MYFVVILNKSGKTPKCKFTAPKKKTLWKSQEQRFILLHLLVVIQICWKLRIKREILDRLDEYVKPGFYLFWDLF